MEEPFQRLKHPLWVKYFSTSSHPLRDASAVLVASSAYVRRKISDLKTLMAEDDGLKALSDSDYIQALSCTAHITQTASYMAAIRAFRHRHLLRLMLREQARLSNTMETMACWSACADALILNALDFARRQVSARFGECVDDEGQRVALDVLAMGKLGGKELNYSSDIDLMFVSSARHSVSHAPLGSQEAYFTKIIQLFVQLMQTVTEEGFVFRVDLRLRPHGDSGALVSSLSQFETYYQEQGRDWERYAMVKARVIRGPLEQEPPWYHTLITPFVYRRYVDFSVLESLRSMKSLIEREIALNPRLNDIKRGLGGIREIEFIIQNIQLIRGGRLPTLRHRNALHALSAIQQEGLLSKTDALKDAYLFFRTLENALQSANDQQTHQLPSSPEEQAQLLMVMRFASWEALLVKLHQYQRIVSGLFKTVLRKSDDTPEDASQLNSQLMRLWEGHIEEGMAQHLLESLSYDNPERCYQLCHTLRHSPRCRRLSQSARMRLNRFMVLLLLELRHVSSTEKTLLRIMQLLDNILGRSAYLALLTENQAALAELLRVFSVSPFIAELLILYPFLLEAFLEEQHTTLPTRDMLKTQLRKQVHKEDNRLECQEVLRQFKLTQWLLAARLEVDGHVSAVASGRFLADVADVIVSEVVDLASEALAERYPQLHQLKHHFAILAYGTFGAKEMSYDSDLDVVFVHQVPLAEEHIINRLTQKILHMLTARSQFGDLYTVDTRLRPSGASGLLISTLNAFLTYQTQSAWTWEHQALIRARVVVGAPSFHHALSTLKKQVLQISRDRTALRTDILTMREKMLKHQESTFAIKHAKGGLIDLEFFVQWLVLSHPSPVFANKTHTEDLLKALQKKGILSKQQSKTLLHAHQLYHQNIHHMTLTGEVWDLEVEAVLVEVRACFRLTQ